MSASVGVPIDKDFPLKCAFRHNLELSTEKIVSCHHWLRLKIAFPWKLIVNQNLWTTNNCKEGKNSFVTNPRSRLSLTCRTWRVAFHHAFKSAFVWLRAIINVHCFAKLQMGLLNLAAVIRSLNHRRARRFFSKTVAASRRRRNLSLIQSKSCLMRDRRQLFKSAMSRLARSFLTELTLNCEPPTLPRLSQFLKIRNFTSETP